MNIFSLQVINYSLSVLKEGFLRHLSIQLTLQQKRVALIAAAIFAYMTAGFLLYYFCFRGKIFTKNMSFDEKEEFVKVKNPAPPLTPIFKAVHSPSPKEKPIQKQPSPFVTPTQPKKEESIQKQPSPLASPKVEKENDKIESESKEKEKLTIEQEASKPSDFNDSHRLESPKERENKGEQLNVKDETEIGTQNPVDLVNTDDLRESHYDEEFAYLESDMELIILEEGTEEEMDYEADYLEEGVSDEQETPIQQFLIINGKSVSLRTLKCLEKLTEELARLNKAYREAIDNGDCFWDAFAKRLSVILNRPVTLEELRQKVSEEVKRLDAGPDDQNWVKKMMKADLMDAYADYRDRVAYSCDEAQQKGFLPVWGMERRDGVILCHLYKVNLKVYSVGCMDEDPSQMNNPENYYFGDDDEYPTGQPYSQTIEIALYPGHFMPVHDTKYQDGEYLKKNI